MADPKPEEPLLPDSSSDKSSSSSSDDDDEFLNPHLNQAFKTLKTFLIFIGLHQQTRSSILLSWSVFLILGVLLPSLIIGFTGCADCKKYQIVTYEFDTLLPQACLAAVSLLCISHNLRLHGLRKFLFVDKECGCVTRFHKEYTDKIQEFFRLLILRSAPWFLLKLPLEVVRCFYMYDSFWKAVAVMLISVCSWTYLTTLSMSASLLFNLVCNLQVIHFDQYGKLLESDSDVLTFVKEHMRLRHHLTTISHRFRIYLLLEFLLVSASQFLTLFQATEDRGIINAINGGNFAVISIAQVVDIVICLHAAAKISHRAQGIASIASTWHALLTCSDADTSRKLLNGAVKNEASIQVGSVTPNFSESDLESLEPVAFSSSAQVSSYHKRQALVLYLQSNPGGVTVFGWRIDRVMIDTIFFVELSLVTFVLGKTLVFTA
ncbi:hypothetical protein ACHQM5_010675 [Ranunculus cassubicifolius]